MLHYRWIYSLVRSAGTAWAALATLLATPAAIGAIATALPAPAVAASVIKRNNEKEMKIAVMKKDLEIEACDVTDIDAFVAEKGKATGPDILLHEFEFQGLRCSVQHKLISLLMLTLTYRTAQINTLTYALLNLLSCR